MNIIIFLIILLVLVLVHEFGHFFAAKRFGIRVDEFGFGFPPKIFGKKFGETEYSLNALPFGGFVKIFGENPDDESMNGPDSARSFVNKSAWKQAIILIAGVFMNFLLAWFLFSIGFMSGLPTAVGSEAEGQVLKDVNLVVVTVLDGSPALQAGLKSGDKIVAVTSGHDVLKDISPDTFKSFVTSHPKEVDIGYIRGRDEIKTLKITPKINPQGEGMIGISMDEIGTSRLSFFPAIWEGLKLTLSLVKATITGLYSLIVQGLRGKGSLESVTGPVGMVGLVGDAFQFGFVYLMSFAALISINLAVINLIPFPALDGGRLLFLLIEKIKGSPINPKIANTLNTIGFSILIILMLAVTYHDVTRLF